MLNGVVIVWHGCVNCHGVSRRDELRKHKSLDLMHDFIMKISGNILSMIRGC